MKTISLKFAATLLASTLAVAAQINIGPGAIVTEDFGVLGSASSTWVDNSTVTGWYAAFTNVGSGAVTTPAGYTATTGGGALSSTLYSMGASSSSERALGGIPSAGAGRLMLAWRLVNTSSETITNLVLSYDGEEWRRDTPLASSVSVSYQVFAPGAGTINAPEGWVAGPASLTFVPPVVGTGGSINGNAPENRTPGINGTFSGLNLQPGQELWIKWYFVKTTGGSFLMGLDNVKAVVPTGAAPVIGAIADLSVRATMPSGTNTFTVNDAEDGPSSPSLSVLFAESSNEAVLPVANVFFGGSGENRTVSVVGGNTPGSADITVTAYDSHGNVGQRTFGVTVLPLLDAPVTTNTLVNTPVAVPFTVYKPGAASSLTVTGWVAAYSSPVLTNVQVTAAADGTNFTALITPVPGSNGVGIVTLSAGDANFANTVSFAIMVLPDATTVLSDHFDYPPNANIVNNSPGFWVRRSVSAGSVNFRTHASDSQAWIRPKASSDDVSAPLAGRPYLRGSGTVLYTMFKAQWNLLEDDVPVVGDSSGPFILLAPNPTATADQLLQIATRTNGVPDGSFRLLVSNGTGSYVEHPTNLGTNTTYTIVARYDIDTATSTLWINAASEAVAGVTAVDSQAPENVSYVTLRQEPDMGHIYLDDLKVLAVRKPVLTTISAPAGGQVEIEFTADPGDTSEAFEVLQADSLAGTFNSISATITSAGEGKFKILAPAGPDQGFYRIKRKPLVF